MLIIEGPFSETQEGLNTLVRLIKALVISQEGVREVVNVSTGLIHRYYNISQMWISMPSKIPVFHNFH